MTQSVCDVFGFESEIIQLWATARLKEYLVKGFMMDDERLKNPPGIYLTVEAEGCQ